MLRLYIMNKNVDLSLNNLQCKYMKEMTNKCNMTEVQIQRYLCIEPHNRKQTDGMLKPYVTISDNHHRLNEALEDGNIATSEV